jgi:hypothetical protein
MKTPLTALCGLALVLTSLFAIPVIAGPESNLDRAYHAQAQNLSRSLRLTEQQQAQVSKLLEERKNHERHLRRQMRTTYTPSQQQQARQHWLDRGRQPMTIEARREFRSQLGVSAEQERQFESYQTKLAAHREQTLILVAQILDPPQQSKIAQMAFDL